jgi:hypothetical protein
MKQEGALVRVTTGPDHGMVGRIVLKLDVGPHDPSWPQALICVKDEPIHRHRFVPICWLMDLEEPPA